MKYLDRNAGALISPLSTEIEQGFWLHDLRLPGLGGHSSSCLIAYIEALIYCSDPLIYCGGSLIYRSSVQRLALDCHHSLAGSVNLDTGLVQRCSVAARISSAPLSDNLALMCLR